MSEDPMPSIFPKEERLRLQRLTFPEYVKLVTPLARQLEVKTGIYYLIPIIQSAHESRDGNSQLCREYGNLFGITVTDAWRAAGNAIASLPTWEVVSTETPDKFSQHSPETLDKFTNADGKTIYKLKIHLAREFKAYNTWLDSFYDWGRLITHAPMYESAYKHFQNKDTAAEGIKIMALNYATDPQYAKALVAKYNQANEA